MSDPDTDGAKLVGINHVAIEVDDINEALAFYGSLFELELRRRSESSDFIDIGDQFIALSETDAVGTSSDAHRHVGIVVDDANALEDRLDAERVDPLDVPGSNFETRWETGFKSSSTEKSSSPKPNTFPIEWDSLTSKNHHLLSRNLLKKGWLQREAKAGKTDPRQRRRPSRGRRERGPLFELLVPFWGWCVRSRTAAELRAPVFARSPFLDVPVFEQAVLAHRCQPRHSGPEVDSDKRDVGNSDEQVRLYHRPIPKENVEHIDDGVRLGLRRFHDSSSPPICGA